MTAIDIQKISISDCEEWIEREYYDWGKLPDEPPWHQELSEDDKRLRITLGYQMYDGCRVPRDARVTSADVGMTIAIYSRANADDVQKFLRYRNDLLRMLEELDACESLLDADATKIKGVGDAIDNFCMKARGVGRSKATKVLHKKRPHFIPVIDYNVARALWANFPHLLKEGSSTGSLLVLFGDLAEHIEKNHSLHAIQSEIERRWNITLTRVRLLSFLLYQWFKRSQEKTPWKSVQALWCCQTIGEARREACDSCKRTCFVTRLES